MREKRSTRQNVFRRFNFYIYKPILMNFSKTILFSQLQDKIVLTIPYLSRGRSQKCKICKQNNISKYSKWKTINILENEDPNCYERFCRNKKILWVYIGWLASKIVYTSGSLQSTQNGIFQICLKRLKLYLTIFCYYGVNKVFFTFETII